MSHKRPWKQGHDDGEPLREKEDAAMTPDERVVDYRQVVDGQHDYPEWEIDPTPIVTQEQAEIRDPSKCQSEIVLGAKDYHCGQPVGHRGSHGARGQALLLSGTVCDFKILWDGAMEQLA